MSKFPNFDVDAPLRTQLSSESTFEFKTRRESYMKNEAKLVKKNPPEKLNIKNFWFSLEGNLILSQVNHLKDLLYHILYLSLKLKS